MAIGVKGIDELVEEQALEGNKVSDKEAEETAFLSVDLTPLAGHITSNFYINRDAKTNSNIKNEILDSLRAFNGEYNPEDLARIKAEGGSEIFMNITATRARAAKSWIADILQPAAIGKAWTLRPSPKEDLPLDIENIITTMINKEFSSERIANQQSQVQPTLEEAGDKIRDINQKARDVRGAITQEITKEAEFELKVMERQIEDQLVEGGFDKALLDFIDDFVVYPTAFLKGPVISKQKKLIWKSGQPTVERQFVFNNERVDPLDIYPSPNATTVNDGNLIEHLRLTESSLAALKGVKGYKTEAIESVIDLTGTEGFGYVWLDSQVESEKADQERRGTEFEANRGIVHGLHFFGPVNNSLLKDWDVNSDKLDPSGITEIEAILAGNEVIKCIINDDPLNRRPYYKASFINRPGAFWGRSLPNLMRDDQRMCNGVARALSNNLGIASGPMAEVNIDLLADQGPIQEMTPRMIWQVKSDPMGRTGNAIQFFQPDSNASELLTVYDAFEKKADDATGIPRYALGNERLAGAGITATGLAMLLESASKIIKDAVRNIDEGLIKPRVESQFYWNLIKDENSTFTGDITVVPIGSSVLTIKGFEAMRRNEFLTVTANPIDQEIMGVEGRADILRTMAEDMGFAGNVIPSNYEIKKKMEAKAAAAAQQAQVDQELEAAKISVGLQATTTQIDGQERMHDKTMQVNVAKLQKDSEKDQVDTQIKVEELALKNKKIDTDAFVAMKTGAENNEAKAIENNKEMAFKIRTDKQGV
ncbi:MAG: hypothetical protein KAS32_25225 [Candidatus Peribacteraceae bacterium]|nr:hypothetical protein [Candidatus Peribacteraceae bacterium]